MLYLIDSSPVNSISIFYDCTLILFFHTLYINYYYTNYCIYHLPLFHNYCSAEGDGDARSEQQRAEYAARGISLAAYETDNTDPYFINLDADAFRSNRFMYVVVLFVFLCDDGLHMCAYYYYIYIYYYLYILCSI